jgi:hypothetical protein
MAFINRKEELSFLEEKWLENKPQLIVLWGKRRVGKTELVKQFIKNKPSIYFFSENTSNKDQLKKFSLSIGKFFNEPLLETRGFGEWEESFKYIKEKGKKFVLAIDEFPYLIQSNPAISSLFQMAWDEYWSKSSIYLIILGSSISMMETEVLGYKAPLYGRRTGQWLVEPMPFDSVSSFRKDKPFEDRLMHYGVAGGIPAYWLQFDNDKKFDDNLTECVLKKGRVLYDEAEFILREELREPRYYFALLQAIALGKRKLSEIVNSTGINQPTANKYLSVLSDLRIVERELPVTEEMPLKSRKGLYRITDEFFQFFFKFIFPKRSELELGSIDPVLEAIKKDLPIYLSFLYERIAMQIISKRTELFFPFRFIGRWWDNNEEIDFIAINREIDSILFGEVKWSNKPVGVDIIENLKRKSKMVAWGGKNKNRKEYYCLFSKSGFTEKMTDMARKDKILLFEGEKLISSIKEIK